jgi:hypothetical protein
VVVFAMKSLVTRGMLGLRARLYCLGLFNILIVHGWIDETFIDDEDPRMRQANTRLNSAPLKF